MLHGVGARIPYAWTINQLCVEFNCLPSEAEAELERDSAREDGGLLWEVLDLRRFAEAKQHYDAALRDHVPIEHASEQMKSLIALEFQIMQERRAARTQ